MLSWVQAFSYPAVFALLAATGVGLPVSEELILLAGGWLAAGEGANLPVMFAVGYAGLLTADGLLFHIGKRLGPRAAQHRWVGRLLRPSRVAWAARHFDHHGALTVFTARFLPGLRAPTFLLAGMSGMSARRFLVADGLAGLVTAPVVIYLGYRFGPQVVDELRSGGKYLLLGIALVLATVLIARRLIRLKLFQPRPQ